MTGQVLAQKVSALISKAITKTKSATGTGITASLISDTSFNTSTFNNPQPTERALTPLEGFVFTDSETLLDRDTQRVTKRRMAVTGGTERLKVGNRIKVTTSGAQGYVEFEVVSVNHIEPQDVLIAQKLELEQVHAIGG